MKMPTTWTSEFLSDLHLYETELDADACSTEKCFRFIAFVNGEAVQHCMAANALEGWVVVPVFKPSVKNRIKVAYPNFFVKNDAKGLARHGIADIEKFDGQLKTKRIKGEVRIVRVDTGGKLIKRRQR